MLNDEEREERKEIWENWRFQVNTGWTRSNYFALVETFAFGSGLAGPSTGEISRDWHFLRFPRSSVNNHMVSKRADKQPLHSSLVDLAKKSWI